MSLLSWTWSCIKLWRLLIGGTEEGITTPVIISYYFFTFNNLHLWKNKRNGRTCSLQVHRREVDTQTVSKCFIINLIDLRLRDSTQRNDMLLIIGNSSSLKGWNWCPIQWCSLYIFQQNTAVLWDDWCVTQPVSGFNAVDDWLKLQSIDFRVYIE